ncbi:MAG: AAA family ATPase, partial [Myxococcota bacterium]
SDVPLHLKDKSRDGAGRGHGAGYLYPHAYQDHWVAQQYLPTSLVGRVFWQPSDSGYEGTVKRALERRREAQLAAMVEAAPEPFSSGPADPASERWLQRAQGALTQRLEQLRDLTIDAAGVERHHRVLDLDARSGLLVWELVRRAPEGQVWAAVHGRDDARALAEVAGRLPELQRPVVIEGDVAEEAAARGVSFERIVGRDAANVDPRRIRQMLAPGGLVVLVDSLPRRAQRLTALVDADPATREAEERVYADPELALGPDEHTLRARFPDARTELRRWTGEQLLTRAMIDRWFAPDGSLGARITRAGGDATHLCAGLRALEGRAVPWVSCALLTVVRG